MLGYIVVSFLGFVAAVFLIAYVTTTWKID